MCIYGVQRIQNFRHVEKQTNMFPPETQPKGTTAHATYKALPTPSVTCSLQSGEELYRRWVCGDLPAISQICWIPKFIHQKDKLLEMSHQIFEGVLHVEVHGKLLTKPSSMVVTSGLRMCHLLLQTHSDLPQAIIHMREPLTAGDPIFKEPWWNSSLYSEVFLVPNCSVSPGIFTLLEIISCLVTCKCCAVKLPDH